MRGPGGRAVDAGGERLAHPPPLRSRRPLRLAVEEPTLPALPRTVGRCGLDWLRSAAVAARASGTLAGSSMPAPRPHAPA
ncbi:hypothetical protein PSMK_30110 [Phycisphaera mikurensis NBRC 102666]|uniref:Uncharacterized protein n=1 Tax=Phycisphaera mikurensis (strain NBRC 102666 / KCTC 22515 / FYK2301M01) TaxID=1142394 RepID=I0IIT2_PHYMF|nr:hypothetical protein PSMK_30110 [Phycisphaera mikurensis NBRC 102666]